MRYLKHTLPTAIGTCTLAAAAGWSVPLFADEAARPLFEEVIVTARRAPRIVMEASETVSVIDHEQLRRNTAHNLADAMRGLPGLQVVDSGQPGLKRVRIRGEDSRRTAILLDGQEITDHWEYGTPLSLNPLLVERIEVVRGSGSVLYGPRALSGVVNFITRKGGTEPLQFEASAGWDSATNGKESFASAFGDLDGLGYRLAASDSDHGKRDTPDGKVDNSAFENRSVYAWAGRDFGAHRVEALYDRYESATDLFIEEIVRTAPPLTDFRVKIPQRDREKLALNYQWTDVASFLPLLKVNLNRAWNQRRFDTFSSTLVTVPGRPGRPPVRIATDRTVLSDAELVMDDAVVQLDWIPAQDHYIVSGVEYSEERVTQDRHVDSISNGIPARPEDIRDKAAIETIALFVQDEWHVGERTTLTLGARQYRVEGRLEASNRAGLSPGRNKDTHTIANLGLSHELGDDLVLRANVSQGYVYPSLLQFAIGAYAASRYVNPNPDLKPETALSWETGVRLRARDWIFDAGVFRNESDDYIEHVFCRPADPCISSADKLYMNIGKSSAQGLEFYAARAEGSQRWKPYLSLTWMERENRYENFTTDDTGVPELSGSLGVAWEPAFASTFDGWVDFALRGETRSKRREPSSTGAPTLQSDDGWLTLNLSGGAQFGARKQFGLVMELENLADKRYSTSAESLLAPGRSVSARVTVAL